jgi:hypothetical protein
MVSQALSAFDLSQITDDAAFTAAHANELQTFKIRNHPRTMHSRLIPSNLDQAESFEICRTRASPPRGAADGYVDAEYASGAPYPKLQKSE